MPEFILEEREIPGLKDLKNISKEAFDADFRSKDRVLLHRFDLEDFDLSGVILTAPIDYALCALEDLSVVTKSMVAWPGDSFFCEESYRRQLSMLRSQGLSKSNIHPHFLTWLNIKPYRVAGGYAELLNYKGSGLGQYRFVAHVTGRELQRKILDIYRRGITQFGEYAFCEAIEGQEKLPHEAPWTYRFERFDPICIFLSPRRPESGASEGYGDEKVEMAMSSLREAIAALEAGGGLPWRVHYTSVVRPPVSVPFANGSRLTPKFELWDEIDFELLSMRCRLIRLLAWPQMFGALTSRFDSKQKRWRIESQYGTEEQRSLLSENCKKFALSYDPIAELDAYILEMQERYPLLVEPMFFEG